MKKIDKASLIGNVYSTINYGDLKIIDYHGALSVVVEFVKTGYITTARMEAISKGVVRDPTYPSIFGIGFVGVGDFKVSSKGKHTSEYLRWHSMFQRCYSEVYHKKQPTYKNCNVCEEWWNFQTFAKWLADNHPKDGARYELDKDILVDGNKTYGPSFCKLVSRQENIQKAKSKHYSAVSPNGVVHNIYNMRKFCGDKNLHQSAMGLVCAGRRKQHKGWTKP